MNWLGELARRLNMLLRRCQFHADLEEQMRLHLPLRRQERLQSGMTASLLTSPTSLPLSQERGNAFLGIRCK